MLSIEGYNEIMRLPELWADFGLSRREARRHLELLATDFEEDLPAYLAAPLIRENSGADEIEALGEPYLTYYRKALPPLDAPPLPYDE